MAKRKTLTQKVRFEVLKRDSFTCQYCGRSAPEVVLEIDHINPVANGGDNDIMNLVTSCFDCNRGKGKRKLTDSEVVRKQKEQLDELNERRKQLEWMLQWKEELKAIDDVQIDAVEDLFQSITRKGFTHIGRDKIKKAIKQFGLDEVLESTELSLGQYYSDDEDTQKAFNYIGRICNTRQRQAKDPKLKHFNYLRKVVKEEYGYVNYSKLRKIVDVLIEEDGEFLQELISLCHECRYWDEFYEQCEMLMEDEICPTE